MTAIKLYLDEDVHTFIAHTLRLRGWEALTTQEAEQREADDVDQDCLCDGARVYHRIIQRPRFSQAAL